MNWEFLGNQDDCADARAGRAAVFPGGVAEQLPGSRSPLTSLSNELQSLLGEFHWKNSKTEGIQNTDNETVDHLFVLQQYVIKQKRISR